MHSTATETKNPLLELHDCGQSVWYDYIRRSLIRSGELDRLIAEDGLRGVTSNPSIWEKAIDGSTDYAEAIDELQRDGESDAMVIYERLAIDDLRDAADAFRPIYNGTERSDGFVSIEVAPEYAHDTEKTIAEGERLWQAIDRENLMVKVPATPEGIPAIKALTARGVNVNITLLFAVPVYDQVVEAYISGLEEYAAGGGDVSRVSSVASFFVSRIDTVVDARLDEVARDAPTSERRSLARGLQGKIAIANAKLAYEHYRESINGDRWHALADRGAHTQRLLWASTSTKNSKYPVLLYVEELIGPDTVNTVPPATFDAFRQHGRARATIEEDVDAARDALTTLADLGISLAEITDKLTADGIDLFAKAFEKLFAAITRTGSQEAATSRAAQRMSLPPEIEAATNATIEEWCTGEIVRRLWARDASLWTDADEATWLGWLGVAEDQLAHAERFAAIVRDVKQAGFTDLLLLGMGGSSLFPDLLSRTFGEQDGFPRLRVLDSTDPAQVMAAERAVDLAHTLFIVSSKSGTTLEPEVFERYFFERVTEAVGADEAPSHFVAITDEGSKLEQRAVQSGFRHVAYGVKSIGGRYSALSDFGMLPGAISGVDVHKLLDRAERMAGSCAACVPPADNPGLRLGATIGACAKGGRDKLTLVTSPPIAGLGAWLEQLLAESTGKQGRGVIPVDREPLGSPDVYGQDRLFVYVRLASAPDAEQDAAVEALEQSGQPVVHVELNDLYDLGSEVFRWEFATAVAGALLGINPFDQPDVEASKEITRELTGGYEQSGALPDETPIAGGPELKLFADERNASQLIEAAGGDTAEDLLGVHFARVGDGDYVALLAYIEMTAEHEQTLEEIRRMVRDHTRAATCLGFGPRFLHSTGQAYKGGPNSGVFVQITCDDTADVDVPGKKYSFGVIKAAQARGDFQALAERGRRALRIHIGEDAGAGLEAIRAAVERVLPE